MQGVPEVPCVGFACGIERIINEIVDNINEDIDVYIMHVNNEEKYKANILLGKIRFATGTANIDIPTPYQPI